MKAINEDVLIEEIKDNSPESELRRVMGDDRDSKKGRVIHVGGDLQDKYNKRDKVIPDVMIGSVVLYRGGRKVGNYTLVHITEILVSLDSEGEI